MKEFDWKDKRVLITGADGFMGSHLTETLIKKGAIVSIYVRGNSLTSTPMTTLRNIDHLKPKIKKIISGDIASRDSIDLIRKNESEYIFHLAADAYVPNSFDHPLEVKETNLDGTLNVLHAIMNMKIKQAVFTSSSEIYGTHDGPIKEEDPLYPSSPYAASKVAADRYAYSYWNTYNLPISIIRPFNTFGPRHTYDVIPKFITLALKNEPLTVYGKGEQTRDFSYVHDTVRGFMIMCSDPQAIGKAVNFGSGKDYKVIDIAKKIIDICGSSSKIVHVEPRKSEVGKLLCDFTLANKLFGWEPTVSIDEGLKRNIEYVKKNGSPE
jgi:nucleoside-diphosphate-sugar epimerase|tara:strand:+ start:130 stop:1101 length:972 start_codon:yes stop_codon:yes gene_type:complete